ncbi:hypothetical protein [Clostridium intestinale]|uniref:Uncharacterized protein n=1 Tax=Clostridium intestinale TaxID=36845 RepID=A0A7D6VTD6_9CLOT|nr:hypothetical protein [Clostridium intestinale]QLY78752.1 hypothetical protein HZF06_16910 [Clostridium intestinale]WRY53838.1 hypothetical protein P8F83_11640 [Clostridium intestinale]
MSINDKLVVKRESLEKLRTDIKVLKVMIDNRDALRIINEMSEVIEDNLKFDEVNIKDKIKDKMTKTESTDPELSFKLYMLYRKLSDGKIDDAEAARDFEIYTMMTN